MRNILVLIIFFLLIMCVPAHASEDTDIVGVEKELPWERFNLRFGGMLTTQDSEFRIDSGIVGTTVDGEFDLGLAEDITVLKTEASYRFGNRHLVSVGYFDVSRDTNRILSGELIIDDEVFPVNTFVDSKFDLRFYTLTYSYMFFQDERIEIGLNAGVYVVDFDVQVKSDSLGRVAEEAYTVPAPMFGLEGNFAIVPKLFFKTSIKGFYITVSDFDFTVIESYVGLEYNILEHFGLGIGYTSFDVDVDSTEEGLFNCNCEVNYSQEGLFFYGKLYY